MKREPLSFKRSLISLVFLCCSLISIPNSLFSAFQQSNWGSRPIGMGGAFTGIADDSYAIIYNPGGLAQLKRAEVSFMYAKLYTGLDTVNLGLSYFSAAVPVRNYGCFGFAWTNFTSADEYMEDAFLISFSRYLSGNIAGGINLKYLGHRFVLDERTKNDPVFKNGNSCYNLTLDAGVLASFSVGTKKAVTAGLAIKNLTQPDVGLKTVDTVPMEITLGASYRMNETIIPAVDLTYRAQSWGNTEDKLTLHLGTETWFFNHILAARGGFSSSEFALGFGLNPPILESRIRLDYSFIWPLEVQQTQGNHYLTLTVQFNTDSIQKPAK